MPHSSYIDCPFQNCPYKDIYEVRIQTLEQQYRYAMQSLDRLYVRMEELEKQLDTLLQIQVS